MIPEFSDKNVVVFGLGKAGISSIKALLDSGAKIFAWDDSQDRVTDLRESFSEVQFIPIEEIDWEIISSLVLSPGIPLTHPDPHPVVEFAKKNDCEIICDIELLYRASPNSIFVGITGTNGKSTTTALLGHIAKEAGLNVEVGGNIGVPASALANLGKEGVYILEVSSYQLDLLNNVHFDISVLLNITPDHLDRHGGMEGYIGSKEKIFSQLVGGDTAIIAIDDEHTKSIYDSLRQKTYGQILLVSNEKELDKGVSLIEGRLISKISGESEKIDIGQLKCLPGVHNAQNIAAAFAVAKSLGLKSDTIISSIKSFPGLCHRIEFVDEIEGVTFINDSKATNAVATGKALQSFDNIFWIAGGLAKDGGISSLSHLHQRIKHAFLVGESEEEFAKELDGKVEFTKCQTIDKAVSIAFEMAKKERDLKPVVLLSPACASFDQFKSFEERGDSFISIVRSLSA